jgi:hypothetical protein
MCAELRPAKNCQKKRGRKYAQTQNLLRANTPNWFHQKFQTIPKCNLALKQHLHKVTAPDLPWLFS